jgi:hypothetical protein
MLAITILLHCKFSESCTKGFVYAGVSLAETVGAAAGAAYSPGESSGA